MAMSDLQTLALAWLAGGALGAVFFGALWWTVRKSLATAKPALWVLGSLLLRIGMTVTGFYFVAAGDWQRLLSCLVGFVMVRQCAIWLSRQSEKNQTLAAQEARHAP